MLDCHEFCGYYEWTFHFMRRSFGQQAVRDLWAEAIGGDSQQHYAKAALEAGLRGLLRVWVKTGEEEACDWSFTLDEEKNVLRWDMRRCPSKGFLIETDRNADEDYCDHCAGWVIPLLEQVGAEVVVHEHNHCGQCWGVMRMRPLENGLDIPAGGSVELKPGSYHIMMMNLTRDFVPGHASPCCDRPSPEWRLLRTPTFPSVLRRLTPCRSCLLCEARFSLRYAPAWRPICAFWMASSLCQNLLPGSNARAVGA